MSLAQKELMASRRVKAALLLLGVQLTSCGWRCLGFVISLRRALTSSAADKAPKWACQRTSGRVSVARAAQGGFNKASFLRREEFDLLSLRDFRRDALIQYRNTNQSEPLRIGIFLLLTLSSFAAPFLAPLDAGPLYYGTWLLVGCISAFFFLRERDKRTVQLVRLEREYSIGDLYVEMAEPLTGSSKKCEVASLRGSRRIVLLYGDAPRLTEAVISAVPYGRRFQQSGVLVIPVAASGADDDIEAACMAAFGSKNKMRVASLWLGTAIVPKLWAIYFEDLLEGKARVSEGAWVALSFKSRVIGSDFGYPVWDELLAALPPLVPLSSRLASEREVPSEPAAREVLDSHAAFYRALLAGDEAAMASLFLQEDNPELSKIIAVDSENGLTNLSPWSVVLAPKARPDLVVGNQDVHLQGQDQAVITCIEFPVIGPTLLATQVWRRVPGAKGQEWRLLHHRTIPYATQVEARVALRCDHRGCVGLGKQLNAMR